MRQSTGHSAGRGARHNADRTLRRVGAGGVVPAPVREPGPDVARMGWREAIAQAVSGLAYELVDVERAARGLLRVTIDRRPGHAYPLRDGQPGEIDRSESITVDDCEQVTRQLQYVLEVEGLDYARLEVSSPGLDRPLKSEADYARFAGQAVSLTLKLPFQGRRHWQGVLGPAVPGPGWQLVFKEGTDERVLGFGLDEVREARLVPVVDFKGRKAGAGAPRDGFSVGGTDPVAAPGVEGG